IKPGMSRGDVLEQARGTLDRWRANPDLIQKSYVMPDEHSAMGIYLWKSKEAAQKGHDDAWMARAEDYWGNRPQITYFDTLMVLDNLHDDVLENP
ncbi:MAG: hypothetical protein K8F25_11895, partial [Fimbriimonadaceae bacterium]|nr:hypothetical protein [Alphaproteobacteria bacterium]